MWRGVNKIGHITKRVFVKDHKIKLFDGRGESGMVD